MGPKVLPDDRLAYHVTAINIAYVKDLHAVTHVAVPGGGGEDLIHEWTHEGARVDSEEVGIDRLRKNGTVVRLRSTINASALALLEDKTGRWHVDVKTASGQLVGRITFTVFK